MRSVAYLSFIAPVLISCGQSGHEEVEYLDSGRARHLEVRIWDQAGGNPKPLILLSHSSGGHNMGQLWLAKSLLANGYVVAAVNHPFNTFGNDTPEGMARIWDRPGDLSYLLTELLSDPGWASRIDQDRIGAAGFSAGGYTVIALAGAIYDPSLFDAYCAGVTGDPACELANAVEVDRSDARNSYIDERIRAVFAMAPPLGPGFDANGLSGINIPVHIVVAQDDALATPSLNARHYAQHIPGADLSILPEGGHWAFLTCDWRVFVADLFIDELDLCGRDSDADREAIQAQVSNEAIAFFDRHLAVSR